MRLSFPSWVNVVLEGGGLTLERALVAYRELARHLRGDWRAQAREVDMVMAQNQHLFVDTTLFANGPHTIGWLVTDSTGQADGIGSRFFTVANGASGGLTAGVGETSGTNLGAASWRNLRSAIQPA